MALYLIKCDSMSNLWQSIFLLLKFELTSPSSYNGGSTITGNVSFLNVIINIGANGYGVSWKRYSSAENNYIIFGSGDNLQSVMRNPLISRTEDAMFKQSVSLWNNLLNNLNNVKRDQEVMKHDSKRMKLTSDVPYRSAMYTLIAFVIVLLVLLVVCVVLLKRHATERERDMF
uniref:Uncharacterized protein n=1 Tax=Rhodnius prolixus TaxID=13249 RepID=T1IB43_RHOPR